jgi:hypothetical protein
MWSSGAAGGAGGAIPVRAGGEAGRGWAWGGLGVVMGRCGRLDLWGCGRQRPSAALPGGGRGSHCSGETEVNAGQPVVVVALVNARGGVGTVAWPRELAGTRLDGGGHGRRRRSKGCSRRSCTCGEGRPSFIVDARAPS